MGKKYDAQYSFFNYIIKLQAVHSGNAQKAVSEQRVMKGSAGLNEYPTVQ